MTEDAAAPTYERTKAAQDAAAKLYDQILELAKKQQAQKEAPVERRLGNTFEGWAQLYSLAIVLIGAAGAIASTWLGSDPTPFYALMASGGVSQAANAWLGSARQSAKGEQAKAGSE